MVRDGAGHRDPSALRKHSVSIRGHRTSYTVEDIFQEGLAELARREGRSIAWLVARVDAARAPEQNLSSAIRVHVMEQFRRMVPASRETGEPERSEQAGS